jgi:predicted membrane protein
MAKQTIFGILLASLLLFIFLILIFTIYDSAMANILGDMNSNPSEKALRILQDQIIEGFEEYLSKEKIVPIIIVILVILYIVIPTLKGKEEDKLPETDEEDSKVISP